MAAQRFAVVVPVGPNTVDLCRALALLASLVLWEPDVGWCVIVEDAPRARGLSELAFLPDTCQAITLLNPRHGHGHYWSGAVYTGVFMALAWIHANTDADFVLIIETDALVVARFAEGVRACLRRMPEAGMLGTLGWTCDERILLDFQKRPPLLAAHRLLPPASADEGDSAKPLFVDGVGLFSLEQRRLFDTVRPHIDAAITNGYATYEYCQGGAQIVTRAVVDRMAAQGYLTRPEIWMYLPFPGEPILAMYTRAAGYQCCACTRPGEPFGVQHRGLPYSLEELTARGHGLIHSIKNDRRYSENEIREFFLKRATNAPGRWLNPLPGTANLVTDDRC